ncbi:MAG TPA: Zn-binding domain-containing protein, partial [Thermoanaerobaculia bacterium]|nr:Zn-binding domain-containing protein [Thermoanaerobaculia bacterium]
WQRSGRVGRAGRESLTAMVALPDALDQYFLDHPDQFFERPCERLVVDPANDPVSRSHLICAAAEMPLSREEDRPYLERHGPRVEKLLDQGHLLEAMESGELFSLRRLPQRTVNLRGTGDQFAILDEGRKGAMIGTIDGVRVLHECHPGAVYLHAGRQYLISALEREERRVRAEAAELDYFTSPLTEKETEVLEVLEERTDGPLRSWLGRLKVTERVVGFERKRIGSQEVIDQRPLELPPVEFETVGLFWAAPRAIEETLRREGEHFMGSLHASEHAAISLFPLLALCDRGDIGGISYAIHPQLGCGAVFVYDGHPGGVGIAAKGYEDLPGLLRRVQLLVEGCTCEVGCPSCVQSPKCGNGNRPLDRAGAARVLRLLLGFEEPAVAWGEPAVLTLAGPHPPAPSPASPAPSPGEGEASREHDLLAEGPSPLGGGGLDQGGGQEGGVPDRAEPQAFVQEVPLSGRVAVTTRGPIQSFLIQLDRRPANGQELRPPCTVLFDLETIRSATDVGGWGNAHRMGVAIGVACILEEGRFEVYGEGQVRSLAETLRAATLVVGFNIKRFDYKVLAGYTGEDYCRTLPTLDLLESVNSRLGFRVGMGHLAQETLGTAKSADGLQSLAWVKQGRLDLVESYCRKDVEILRDLYLHGRREGCIFYRDRRRDVRLRLCVDW